MIHIYLREAAEHPSEAARSLLFECLARDFGINHPVMLTGTGGKPYLKNGPYFSISHSRGMVGVAISPSPVGLDMEMPRTVRDGVPERVCSPEEYRWYCEQGKKPEDFLTLWILKESYYKYLGTGLPGFPNGTEFIRDGEWRLRGSNCRFFVQAEKELLIAVCSHEQQEIILHRG